jgi:hypothetical protein
MHRYLHIGVATNVFRFDDINSLLPMIADDWTFYSVTNWIVWSDKDVMFITGAIRAKLSAGELFLIAELNLDKPTGGYLPPPIWEWINRKRPQQNYLLGQQNPNAPVIAPPR